MRLLGNQDGLCDPFDHFIADPGCYRDKSIFDLQDVVAAQSLEPDFLSRLGSSDRDVPFEWYIYVRRCSASLRRNGLLLWWLRIVAVVSLLCFPFTGEPQLFSSNCGLDVRSCTLVYWVRVRYL
jgi:hypothetical protein